MYQGFKNYQTFDVAYQICNSDYILWLIDYLKIKGYVQLRHCLVSASYFETDYGTNYKDESLDTKALDSIIRELT